MLAPWLKKMCCLKRGGGGGHGMANFEQLHATTQNIYIYVHIYILFVEMGFQFHVSCLQPRKNTYDMVWLCCIPPTTETHIP